MTYSLPKREACRDGVGVAYSDINSIDGRFFLFLWGFVPNLREDLGLSSTSWLHSGPEWAGGVVTDVLEADRGSLPEEMRFSHGLNHHIAVAVRTWGHQQPLFPAVQLGGNSGICFFFKGNVRYKLPRVIPTVTPSWGLKVTLSILGFPSQLSLWKVVVVDRCFLEGQREGLWSEQLLSLIKPKQVWGESPG